MAAFKTALLLLGALLLAEAVSVLGVRQPAEQQIQLERKKHRKPKHPFTAPTGLFIQERASKMLPGPGQHFNFGALKSWEEILPMLDDNPDRKLLLVVRHGQAISNYLGDTLGPDEWFRVEGTCQYDDQKGTIWNIFDADLTGLGQDQAKSLNSILLGGGWYTKMTGDKPARFIISPLTRCLHTATIVLEGFKPNATNVEEFVRETLGEDTCDARRSVSNPNSNTMPEVPCSFDKGIGSTYPQYKYRVYDPNVDDDRRFGLLGDSDHLWTKNQREQQKHQVKRATKFLNILFKHAPEQIIVVITHSGFARSLLLAVQREPYRPMNAELIPVIVDHVRKGKGNGPNDTEDAHAHDEDDDSWIDEVLKGYEHVDLSEDDRLFKRSDSTGSTTEPAGQAVQKDQHYKIHGCILRTLLKWVSGWLNGHQASTTQ